MFSCFILLAFVYSGYDAMTISTWAYRNDFDDVGVKLPADWGKVNKDCDGQNQSPININFHDTKYDGNLQAISITRIDENLTDPETWTMENKDKSGKL
jgi:hypothetical protein